MDVLKELVDIIGDVDLAGCDVLVDPALALLPLSRPKPRLVGGHGDVRVELDNPIVSLHDLDLGPRLIQMETSSQASGQDNLASAPHTDK
jgi:hypothetical protein